MARRGRAALCGAAAMRAAVLEKYGEPLRVQELAEPKPSEREALVRVQATGLCGTDLKLTAGALAHSPVKGSTLPRIPGHEIAGELLESVGGIEAGQRVACYIYDTCGVCSWCRAGRNTLCPQRERLGMERNGGLAELVAVPRRNLLPFSDRVAFAAAAVTMDAVAVPWTALSRRAQLQSGEKIAIAGAGGLGLHAIQIARHMGGEVAVLDPVERHRAAALELGAALAVDPGEVEGVRDWADGGTDAALEASGSRGGFEAAAGSLRKGGRIVCLGYFPGVEYGLDSPRLVLDEIDVLGSVGPAFEGARAALTAVERSEVEPLVTESASIDEVNHALDRLRAGEVMGRMVVQM